MPRRGAAAVLDVHRRDLELLADAGDARVVAEVGADEPAVPRPVVLGVRRGVNARVAAAGPDVALERGLLGGVEHVAGRAQEDHYVAVRQIGVGEQGGVLRGVDLEAVLHAHLSDLVVPDGMHSVWRNAAVLEDQRSNSLFLPWWPDPLWPRSALAAPIGNIATATMAAAVKACTTCCMVPSLLVPLVGL